MATKRKKTPPKTAKPGYTSISGCSVVGANIPATNEHDATGVVAIANALTAIARAAEALANVQRARSTVHLGNGIAVSS